MRNLKVIVAGAIGLAAAGGGIAAAATTGSAAPPQVSVPAQAANPADSSTIKVATALVNGRSERILVDSQGLPLYTYAGDTPTTSAVTGQLAAIWPPLISTDPTESGVSGQLTTVMTTNGSQVQYAGHFLYTFLSDSAGHVTGQGVQNFFVATAGRPSAPPTAQAKSAPNHSYGY